MHDNKALMRRIVAEVFNRGNLEMVDQLFAENFVHQGSGMLVSPDREGLKQITSTFHTAFPDFHVAIQDVIGEGDRVSVRVVIRGTHHGPLPGIPPTGHKVEFSGLSFFRMEGGKPVEGWNIFDVLTLLRQIGVVPIVD